MEWFKIAQIAMLALGWYEGAQKDGKVTEEELTQLATMAGYQLGYPIMPHHLTAIFELIAMFRHEKLEIEV